MRASIAVFPLRVDGTSCKGMPWPLNRVHALFQLIYTEEAASHPARPAGSLKALAIVSRVVTTGASS